MGAILHAYVALRSITGRARAYGSSAQLADMFPSGIVRLCPVSGLVANPSKFVARPGTSVPDRGR